MFTAITLVLHNGDTVLLLNNNVQPTYLKREFCKEYIFMFIFLPNTTISVKVINKTFLSL